MYNMKAFSNVLQCTRRLFLVAVLCQIYLGAASQTANCNFAVSDTVMCLPVNKFVFNNLSQGNALQYLWDFNDGTTSADANPTKVYTTAGVYNVTLRTTENGIQHFFSKQITVAPMPTVSQIDIQKTFYGKSYTYISSSTIQFGYMFYYWEFADSVNSILINPVHTYKNAGNYDVQLTVTSNYGCVAHGNKLVNITEYDSSAILPIIHVNTDKLCVSGNFVFNYTGDTAGVTSITWDFGDNTFANTLTATKAYNAVGTYIAKLTIVKNGVSYENYKMVTVEKSVKANFTYTVQPDSSTVAFQVTDTANQNATTTYNWNFNNGCANSNVKNAQQFFYAGTYNVLLKVTNSTGCYDSIIKPITILSSSSNTVVSKMSINNSIQCLAANSFVFTNQSSTSCDVQYLWNFGDGTTSTAFQPTKVYANAGTYTVSLTTTIHGSTTTTTTTVTVTTADTWMGTVNNDWFNAANWSCGLPSATTDVLIKSTAAFMPIVNANVVSCNNIDIENGASITATNSTINVYGNINNAGIFDAKSTNINCVGSTLQTITGIIEVANFVVNNTAGVQIGNAATDSIKVYNSLNLTAGNFNTNNKLVLRSTATNTAKLNKVNEGGNTGTLTGDVVVERYFQSKRAWRFFTMPFAANGSNSNYTVNNTLQKFTNVTGVAGGVGYDYNTSYYSLNTWNDATNKWNNITNTLTTYTVTNSAQCANVPFYILIRGNKSTPEALKCSEVTMAFSGKLQTGTQQINFSGKQKGNYFFVGNPYASPVDLAVVQPQSKSLTGNYYYWDPTLNTTGAYVTISNKGNGVWIATPVAAQRGRYMQSCQAMLFEVSDTAGFVKFTEAAKSDTVYANVEGSANGAMDKLSINLYRINKDNTKDLLDGAITIFKDNFSVNVDANDSKKILNPQENIGFINGNDILAIESRPYISGQDSLHIHTSNLNDSTQYAIEIVTEYFDTTVQQIVLVDSLIKNKTNANFSKSTWYYFNTNSVNTNAARFSLALKSTKPVYGKVESINATKQDKKVKVDFWVDAEQEVNKYDVEYSYNNENNFASIKTLYPLNDNKTNTYNCIDDVNEKAGKHFYRIKSTTKANDVLVSNTAMVEYAATPITPTENKDFVIYPNPAKDNFNLHMYSNSSQWVILKLIDPVVGKVVFTQNLLTKQGENIFTINNLNGKLHSGMYIVNVVAPDDEFKPVKLIVVK